MKAYTGIDNFAIIIGAMKCGTTSMYRYLSEHPHVAACSRKEPHFFQRMSTHVNWEKGWSWYEGLWDWDPARHKVAVEASTGYSKVPIVPNTAERLLECSDTTKFRFIYMMRDPIARIESHCTNAMSARWNTSLEHLIAFSSYAQQIDEFACRFPRSTIKLVVLEDLVSRPVDVMQDVFRFIGVDPSFTSPHFGLAYNKNRYRPTHPLILRFGQSSLGQALLRATPYSVKNILRFVVGTNRSGNIRLPDSRRAEILSILAPDLRRLRDDYGVDTSVWRLDRYT